MVYNDLRYNNNHHRLINKHMINMLAIRLNVIDKISNIKQYKYLTNKEKKRKISSIIKSYKGYIIDEDERFKQITGLLNLF